MPFLWRLWESLFIVALTHLLGNLFFFLLFRLLSVSKPNTETDFAERKGETREKREERKGRGLRWWGVRVVRVVRVRWPSSLSSYLFYGRVKQFGWPYRPAAPSASPRKSRTTSSFWPITSSFPTTTPTPPPSPPRFACFPQFPLLNSKQLWCQNFHSDDSCIGKPKPNLSKLTRVDLKGLHISLVVGIEHVTWILPWISLFHLCDMLISCYVCNC